MRRAKTYFSKIRNESREIITNTTEIQKTIKTALRTYFPINWKILNKLTNLLLMAIPN
jgi:hypothetical protein